MTAQVVHLIAGLELGGAQMTLCRLLERFDRSHFDHRVISLTGVGAAGERIRALGIEVRALGMRPGVPNPWGLLRLARWLRREPPNILHTWMYHSDLIGALAARLAHGPAVVWSVRTGRLRWREHTPHTLLAAWLCARLSRWLPARIVCCTEASRRWHQGFGYDAAKLLAIPNGIDTNVFRPSPSAPLEVRSELGMPEDCVLIGLVARYDPQKDHATFLAAAPLLRAGPPPAHFLLCGQHITWANRRLAGQIERAGLRGCCHLLGERQDVPRLLAALDVAVLCSTSEGFGNVVPEAMACGVPCAITEAGELPGLVAGAGKVVPCQNPPALAEAVRELLALPRERRAELGLRARQRVQQQFDWGRTVLGYETLYREIAAASIRR